ncbi:NUDIX hydrolase [Phenylobacterium sp.]|jgi:8-oxo-dGTP pyrophosphatase MutT (NUDIX family)|uniref:NUDIX hydrolase n=1 Tax=Phenylobacterium sp. TaxID=1871053 RepID=UPI002F421474
MTEQIFDPPQIDDPSVTRPAGTRAVRPKDAGALILVRRDGARPQVLMGRRNRGHSFMPDKWVFPGGRVDPGDARAPYATDLRPEVAAMLRARTPEARARAVALAAVRETFEEAGLLLARPAPARSAAGPWREFLAQGALPDLDALDLVARAITPPALPKRFDARFFMADAERLLTLERQPDCGELDEIAWVNLQEAMKLDLPNVTRFILQELEARLEAPDRNVPFVRAGRRALTVTHL